MIEKTRGVWDEFKAFALKGNIVELGVAVVVGGAFSGVVNSLATDILGPFISLLTNSVDFKTLSYTLRPDLIIKYGTFLQACFNFLVIAVTVFVVLKVFRLARRKR